MAEKARHPKRDRRRHPPERRIKNKRLNRTFCSRTLCAGRRNVYDFLFRKAIHFQSTEFARRADNQRSAGLPGGLADSNKAVICQLPMSHIIKFLDI